MGRITKNTFAGMYRRFRRRRAIHRRFVGRQRFLEGESVRQSGLGPVVAKEALPRW